MNLKIIAPFIALAALTATASAQPAMKDGGLHVLRVRDNIFMIVGGGGNTTVQTGEQGVLVVNTKEKRAAEDLLGTIRKITAEPIGSVVTTHSHPALEGASAESMAMRGRLNTIIRVVINTDSGVDQTGGNAVIGQAGKTVAGGNVTMDITDATRGARIFAHENTLLRLSGAMTGKPAIEQPGWPTSTFFGKQKAIFFNREAVRMYYAPAAQTDGDLIVFFRRSDVISTGDLFNPALYPVIDLKSGGTIDGVIAALNHVIDLSTPAFGQEGGTLIVPGHGHLSNYGEIVNYRDMVTVIRDRIRALIKQGKSLKQVKAARPSMDYDPVYGATDGPWTTDMFIEAAYKSLMPKKKS
ncbi:MAG TPA: hypothetical protein VKA19_14140 [Alphaproteobacteria bacterium]|nr:hypothetical protein [Alphaproteobacteria bacterium]